MIIEFSLIATGEIVRIRVPRVNLSLEVPDLVVFDNEKNILLDLGVSVIDFQNKNTAKWNIRKEHISFINAFSYSEFNPELALLFLTYYIKLVGKEIQNGVLSRLIWSLATKYDLNLRIENYEHWPIANRNLFEYSLLAKKTTRHLVINDHSVGLSAWKRNLERCIRSLFTGLGPLALILISSILLLRSSINTYLCLVYILCIYLSCEIIGKFSWMLLMKRLLPTEYLLIVLPVKPFPKLTKYMANSMFKHNQIRLDIT